MAEVTWTARMITPAVDLVAPVFRREVTLEAGHGAVASAVLHVSSLGVHECSLDGVPVSPDVLSPGWSAYEWRCGTARTTSLPCCGTARS
jgi:alpha-L-rhamnosidase